MNPAKLTVALAICMASVPILMKAEDAKRASTETTAKPAIASSEKSADRAANTSVYAKIIIPLDKPAEGKQAVEAWIAKELASRGKTHVTAASEWVRLGEPGADKDGTTIWNGVLGGKTWGCPAWGQVMKRTADGMVKVKLDGFLPVVPSVKGATLAAKPGSTAIAEIQKGMAYAALRIGPPDETPTPPTGK